MNARRFAGEHLINRCPVWAVGGADGPGDAAGEVAPPQPQKPPQATCGGTRGKSQNRFKEMLAAVTIKDFKVGQTAYILEDGYRGAFGTAIEVEVAKVGWR